MTPNRGVEFGGEGMGYMQAYQRMWQNFVKFDGRAGLGEYWKATLINIVVIIVLMILSRAAAILLLLYFLYAVALILPGLGLTFRRLHDTGRSGWWWLISVIPLLGSLYLIYLLAQPSSPAGEKYGPAAS
ncbi:MAG: DUF805 domain-containing protein [Candidatus Dormibacteria bacterium]